MTSSKIIVGVDGSAHSARAVQWCADHAAALDAEVVAVHALDVPMYIGAGVEYRGVISDGDPAVA
jgi:nucleotide-binding universal stress UspA family protein